MTPKYLAELSEHAQAQLRPRLTPWRLGKDETVFVQGERVNKLYMLDSGSVRCEVTHADGRSIIVGFGQPGRCFGDVETFDDIPALSTATSNSAITGWTMDAPHAFEALSTVPEFARLMTRTLARVGRIHHQMYQYALLREPHERLAITLLSMSRNHAEREGDEQVLVRVTQDMLSRIVGVSRQCVSKHLRRWADLGWIDIQYGGIRVSNSGSLMQLLPGSP
jgi:CRP/FNR family cyclic AMP-dependent transcriptional regulator